MLNTADLGITTQKLICDKFSLELHPNAVNQFAANFNPEYQEALLPLIDSEDIKIEAVRLRDSLSEAERDELLESIAKERADKIVREIIERNFKKIQAEVKAIIDRECQQPQDIRMVDPFA